MNRSLAWIAVTSSLTVACSGATIDGGSGTNGAAVGPAEGAPEISGDSTPAGTTDNAPVFPPPPENLVSPCEGYALIERRNIAAPRSNATGITYDGSHFWLMSGGHNTPPTHTLVRFSPDTAKVDRSFTFEGLVEGLGTGVGGIAWDGTAIWISVSGNTNKLVTVDPTTGQITRTMSSPSNTGPVDLDFDGQDLWLSSGTGQVFRLDRTTGGIKSELAAAEPERRDHGIAVRAGGELWVGKLFGGMQVFDSAHKARPVLDGACLPLRQERVGPSFFFGPQLVILSGHGISFYAVATPP